jgi:hypothetical protein
LDPHLIYSPARYGPRVETVSAVYAKLQKHKYVQVFFRLITLMCSNIVQVRGTPASGKTALATLLIEHIQRLEPDTHIVLVVGWGTRHKPGAGLSWLKKEHGWEPKAGSILVVDEAQASYDDNGFWNMIKSIRPESRCRVITFACFGSAGQNPNALTPGLPPVHTVSLRAIDYGDKIIVGLLLNREELTEVIETLFPGHHFHADLLDAIFELTDGHVGVCEDLLRGLSAHEVRVFGD